MQWIELVKINERNTIIVLSFERNNHKIIEKQRNPVEWTHTCPWTFFEQGVVVGKNWLRVNFAKKNYALCLQQWFHYIPTITSIHMVTIIPNFCFWWFPWLNSKLNIFSNIILLLFQKIDDLDISFFLSLTVSLVHSISRNFFCTLPKPTHL